MFLFGDGFDLYTATIAEAYIGGTYWDSSAAAQFELSSPGRFSGSRGLLTTAVTSATVAGLTKSSGSNDAIHHLVLATQITTTLTGTTNQVWFTLYDGSTAQCSVVFRSDGAILLTSGASNGATLATYASALTAASTWYAFEIEIVINNTTGSIAVRKNGNTSNDFSATALNTRGGTANNYANKLSVGSARTSPGCQHIDDLLWRSDPSAVAWVGDIRCWTRTPASDSSAQWTRSASVVAQAPFVQGTTATITNGAARYSPFTATCSGTVGTVTLSLALGYTGNLKCTIFNDSGSTAPGTVLGSATTLNNPVLGNNTITFASPPSITRGTAYWIGFDADTTTSVAANVSTSAAGAGAYGQSGVTAVVSYASFPTATPSVTPAAPCNIFTLNITPTTVSNAMLVSEAPQDGTGTYLLDSTVTDADFYVPGAITVTPAATVAVVTRGLFQKSDAGTRNVAVQVKSGATTSAGTSTALNTTWGWVYKTDQTDPDTGVAWTATGVNNLTFGAKTTA